MGELKEWYGRTKKVHISSADKSKPKLTKLIVTFKILTIATLVTMRLNNGVWIPNKN